MSVIERLGIGPQWLICLLLAVSITPTALAADDVDQVLAKHIEARGGAQAWADVDTLALRGQYTGFSKTHPFTLHRMRGDEGVVKYSMDQTLGDKRRLIGWDGEVAWWEDGWTGGAWADPVTGSSLAVVMQDAEMVTPLFDGRDRGFEIELLGEAEVEGSPALELSVTRPSGEQETWFLDPETYLEIARDATTDEFGRPMRGRMFFDDFRTGEGGLVLPHYTEVEWATRHRVMEIESVEVNPEIDPAIFLMPPPPGMGPLQSFAGRWQVDRQSRQSPGAPMTGQELEVEIIEDMAGKLYRWRKTVDEVDTEVLLSYDRYGQRYRMVAVDSRNGQINVLEGLADEDGAIVVSNIDTGTTFQVFDFNVFARLTIADIEAESFKVLQDISLDGGANWQRMIESAYTRAP